MTETDREIIANNINMKTGLTAMINKLQAPNTAAIAKGPVFNDDDLKKLGPDKKLNDKGEPMFTALPKHQLLMHILL